MTEEYRTKSGKVLTDAEIQELADEAEKGYDVEHLKEPKEYFYLCRSCGRHFTSTKMITAWAKCPHCGGSAI